MGPNIPDKPVPREIRALLSDERPILRETQRAVTPFGGVAVFLSFIDKISLVEKVRQHMPIHWKSPNHIDPTAIFTAFLMAVLVGVRRCAHASLLRGDRALHALLGLERFPTDGTIRNLFREFGMGQIQRMFEPLAEWQLQCLPPRRRATPWTWIRRSSSVTENRRARSKGTTPASTDGPATIPCWPCCAKPTSSSTAGCAAATAEAAAAWSSFSKKRWRCGDNASRFVCSARTRASLTTGC